MLIYWNSRWRSLPSWISKIGCHFFAIGLILANSGRNVENLTKSQLSDLKCTFNKRQEGVRCHFEFRICVAISLLLDQSSLNLVEMLRIWHRTPLLDQKCMFTKIKDGGRRHLEFRKCVAIYLLLDQPSLNLVEMLRIWHRTQLSDQKCICNIIQDGGHWRLTYVLYVRLECK